MTDQQKADRQLSNDVFAIAQAAKGVITEQAWSRLLDAGLRVRELSGLPPPWEDQEKGTGNT